MASFLGARAAPVIFNKNVVAVGDSLTYGYGSDVPSGTFKPYPSQLATRYGSTVRNFGHPAAGWTDKAPYNLSTWISEPLGVVLTNPVQTLILWAGTNDFVFNTATPEEVFAAMMSYMAQCESYGYSAQRTIIPTMLPRNSMESYRTPYNALIVSGAATYGYTPARFDLDSRIGTPGKNTDLAYYIDDQIHMNEFGYAAAVEVLAAVMG